MPKSNSTADKTPANKQKGKKQCTCCHKEKRMTEFYLSYSPMYSLDKRVPVCKECCKNSCLNDNGSIDFEKLKELLRNIDKPLYYDLISSAEESIKKENSYLSDEDLQFKGYDILSKYFTLVAMRQDRAKSYSDSEKEGFMHTNNNRKNSEKKDIIDKFRNVDKKIKDNEKIYSLNDDFIVTQDMIDLFGEGYTPLEYKKMTKKYKEMSKTYVMQTSIHKEALVTYVRFKVKEEIATAKGEVTDAQKWYSAAQNAAEQGKLTAKQISKEDLQGGLVNFSDIFSAVEGAKENYESKWVGAASGALVNINKLMNCRSLAKPVLRSINDDEEYYLGVDVARSQKTNNNQSFIAVVKVNRTKDKSKIVSMDLVNLINIPNIMNFTAQACTVKKYKILYNAKAVICDGNGLGAGLIDELLKESFDPITKESLGCFDTINDDNEPEVPDIAEKILYNLKAQSAQSKIVTNFIDVVDSGKFRMLEQRKSSDFTEKEYDDFDNKVAPFLQTDALFEELANLKLKHLNNGGVTIEKVVNKLDKDRVSALIYVLWYICEFARSTYSDSDYDFVTFVN